MSFNFQFSILPWFVFLPLIGLLLLFLWHRRQYRVRVYFLIAFLLLMCLQPQLSWTGSADQKKIKVALDLSFPLALTEPAKLLETFDFLKKNGYTSSDFTDFNSNPVSQTAIKAITSADLSTRQSSLQFDGLSPAISANTLVISADVGLANFSNVLFIPPQPNKIGIYSANVPAVCFEGESCLIHIELRSIEANVLFAKEGNRVLGQKVIPATADQIKKIDLEIRFGKFEFPHNRSITLELQKKEVGLEKMARLELILALQKGQPAGSFYYEVPTINSWRIANTLAENSFLKITASALAMTKGSYNQKDQFRIELYEENTEANRRKILQIQALPVFKILKNNIISPKQLAEKFSRKSDTLFVSGNNYWLLINDSILKNSVFWPVESVISALEEFTATLKSDRPPFLGQAVENDRPVLLREDIRPADIEITTATQSLQFQYNYLNNYGYFKLFNFDEHQVRGKMAEFKFTPLLSARERRAAAVDLAAIDGKLQKIEKILETLNSEKNKVTFEKKKIQLGFIGQDSQALFYGQLIILVGLLAWLWYFSIERNALETRR